MTHARVSSLSVKPFSKGQTTRPKTPQTQALTALALSAALLLTGCANSNTWSLNHNSDNAHNGQNTLPAHTENQRIKNTLTPAQLKAQSAQQHYEQGMQYFDGLGVAQDKTQAVQWFQKAAEQDHATAQAMLGLIYFVGSAGVKKNHQQSAYWLKKAGHQGQIDSQYMLGDMYASGRGFDADTNQAIQWYQKAAEQGHSLAQKKLDQLQQTDQPKTTTN